MFKFEVQLKKQIIYLGNEIILQLGDGSTKIVCT
jgi:hypothetical protein